MDLQKIQEMFDKDSKIDETNINLEETRSPALLNKYLKLYTNFRLMLSKAETDMKILKKQKWEYYSGKSEKPFELKILRQDIPTYLESDEDMVRLQSKLDYLKVVSSYLDNPKKIDEQILKTQTILKSFKTNSLSSTLAANALNKYL